jgi:hypothetical protein
MLPLGMLGVGTLVATLAAAIEERGEAEGAPRARPIALWVADRDSQRICALDSDLLVERSFACPHPLAVRARRDGGCWVLRGERELASRAQRLERRNARGETVLTVGVDACAVLSETARDDALLIEIRNVSHSDRAWRVQEDGTMIPILEREGLACLAASSDDVVLGTTDGSLVRVDARRPGEIGLERRPGGRIIDLAPGPYEGTSWALEECQGIRLALLEQDLSVRWSVRVDLSAAHLAPIPGEERVWLCDALDPRARRFGPRGRLEIDARGLPLLGIDRAVAWSDGGAVIAAPGALLHLDGAGHLRPGQGGFEYLSDLDRPP